MATLYRHTIGTSPCGHEAFWLKAEDEHDPPDAQGIQIVTDDPTQPLDQRSIECHTCKLVLALFQGSTCGG